MSAVYKISVFHANYIIMNNVLVLRPVNITDQLDRVTAELESMNRKLDAQRKLIRQGFSVIIGKLAVIMCVVLIIRNDGTYLAELYCKSLDGRTFLRRYAEETFAWLFLSPWVN